MRNFIINIFHRFVNKLFHRHPLVSLGVCKPYRSGPVSYDGMSQEQFSRLMSPAPTNLALVVGDFRLEVWEQDEKGNPTRRLRYL